MEGDKGGVVNCFEFYFYLFVLVISGLDYDVKIWVFIVEVFIELIGLKDVIKKNKWEWDEDSLY